MEMLLAYSLRNSDRREMIEILLKINENETLKAKARQSFRDYASDVGEKELVTDNIIWRAFSGEPKLPNSGPFNALMFDFLAERFADDVLDELQLGTVDSSLLDEVTANISSLLEDVRNRISEINNPFSLLAADIEPDELNYPVPEEFINEFIGYRRSSNDGDVVRFYFRIYRPNRKRSAFVRYKNRYKRGERDWRVQGGGLYSIGDQNMYLFGHARDQRKRTKGYRVQSLKQLGTTSMLCGPIISQDRRGPISARIVLVPLDDHMQSLTSEQEAVLNEKGKPGLIDRLIADPTSMGIYDYIDEIKHNMTGIFDPNSTRDIFYYLSNLTPTVIHGSPSSTDEFMHLEAKIRKFCFENEDFHYSEQLMQALKKHLQYLEQLPRH